jgi:hypothetical protein
MVAQLIETHVPAWTADGDVTRVPPIGLVPVNDNRESPFDDVDMRYPGRLGASFHVDAGLALPPLPVAGAPLIGLTGKRNVGKSTVATLLEEEYGFQRVHAFEGGKEAAVTWFCYLTDDYETARAMVYGDLKDRPSPYLPGGVAPRYFLEKFGHFMGATMGVDWTLGMEVRLARKRNPRAPIVVESLVYEVPWFRAQGGRVVRLVRPGHEGPAGIETDAVQAAIAADATISATTVDDLGRQARALVQQMIGGR